MKKWFVAGGIVIALLFGGYLILSFYAVKFIQPQLQRVMGPGLTVAQVKIKTTCLSVQKIEYEDPHSKQKFLRIEEVRIYPSLFSFLKGRPQIRELLILQPFFYFYRSREGTFIGPWLPMEKKEKNQGVLNEKKVDESSSIGIDRVRVENGSFDFEDQKYGRPQPPIQFREMNFSLENIRYPIVSAPSPFDLKGKMEGRTKRGRIEAKGWIDLQTADMESILKVREVEVRTFEPYYQKKVSAEIESGTVHLEAKIDLRERMIDAPGSIELTDLRIKEEGTVFWIPAKTLASLLKDKKNRIKAQFHVQGNMDDPKFNLQENVLARMGFSLGEALGLPMKSVGETILGGAGKGAEGLSEGVKSMGEIFRRREKKR